MPDKVLITGGAGFIGYHLARKLAANGDEIVLVDDFSRGVRDPALLSLCEEPGVSLLDLDVRDGRALDSRLPDDFDYIYHLAAIIGVQNVMERPYETLRDNASMVFSMIDVARRQGHLRRFVFTSTSEVYDGTLKYFGLEMPEREPSPLTVSDCHEPRTSYMLSKIYGETTLLQSGLPATIVRPFNFYGPRMGMAHVIDQKMAEIHRACDGELIAVASPSHRRTFCYIDDAVEMMVGLAGSERGLGVFNVGSSLEDLSMLDLCRLIAEVAGKRIEFVGERDTQGSPVQRRPSMEKTFGVVGNMTQTPMVEGLRRTYGWYVEHIFEGNDVCAR